MKMIISIAILLFLSATMTGVYAQDTSGFRTYSINPSNSFSNGYQQMDRYLQDRKLREQERRLREQEIKLRELQIESLRREIRKN